jgi:1-acyl-sn-glycerol-3-phosphate acyltransferase
MIGANHVSWLDVFLVSSVKPTRFIAKSEVRDWPGRGLDRGARGNALRAARAPARHRRASTRS